METPQWTKDRPAESGYYWYREDGSEPEIIEWAADMQWVMRTGSDIMLADGHSHGIDGEFWPEAIRLPNAIAQAPKPAPQDS